MDTKELRNFPSRHSDVKIIEHLRSSRRPDEAGARMRPLHPQHSSGPTKYKLYPSPVLRGIISSAQRFFKPYGSKSRHSASLSVISGHYLGIRTGIGLNLCLNVEVFRYSEYYYNLE